MDSESTVSTRAGKYVRQQSGPEGFLAFNPNPLPPEPPIVMDRQLAMLHEAAALAIGRLEGASANWNPENLLYMYARKEAVVSSQIEGTQSTLYDLLSFENAAAPGAPLEDVREVSRYVDALLFGVEEIRKGELPLSLRLLREMHARLLARGRGSHRTPGEFRRTQNWVGGTKPSNALYVPPPSREVIPALGNLEKFLHDEYGVTPPLVKAGIAHAQFETIHPFLDGNGRIGRLLISLLLLAEGLLTQPYFYISLYFKENRRDYYALLQDVRTKGAWEDWLLFFLIGVEAVATQASQTAKELALLFEADRMRIAALGRVRFSGERIFGYLIERIVISPTKTAKSLSLSIPTVLRILDLLEEMRIVEEITGRRRDRLFAYRRQLELLDRGTDYRES